MVAHGYDARDVARLLDLTPAQVRSFVRKGLVDAARGPHGEYRFSFQDLVLLRVARDLVKSRIPARRLRRSLDELRRNLPAGRSLSELRIGIESNRVVVDDGTKRWNPESGQLHFGFEVRDLARRAAPIAERRAAEARDREGMTAGDWYDIAFDLEATSLLHARAAYERALDVDPDHAPSLINLGRLLHEAGDIRGAEECYRRAMTLDDDPTAAFNLGVALEDGGRLEEAIEAYREALSDDPRHADAHYNVAGVYERLGRRAEALRHFRACRELTADPE